MQSVYDKASASLFMRLKDEIAPFFDGMNLSEPGIVSVSEWNNHRSGRHAFFATAVLHGNRAL